MEQQSTNICRTCLIETGDFQSIFVSDESTGSNIHLAEMIMSYASVQITLGDGLPEVICSNCARRVSNFYLFKLQCEESDTALRNRFGISPYKKPYSIQEEEKLSTQNLYHNECLDVIIKSEFATEDYKGEDHNETSSLINNDKHFECDACNKVLSSSSGLIQHKKVHCKAFQSDSDRTDEEINSLIDPVESNVVEINPETVLGNDPKSEETSAPNEIEEIVITGSTNLNLFSESSSEKYGCKFCGFLGENEDELGNHECDTKKTNLECKICGKLFGKTSHLNRHLKIHSAVKPHICVLCGKGFARAEQLTNHMNMHSGVKPHVCKICAKGFNQISNLKDHMRTHNGEKPFLCSTCGKGFNQLGNLRQHTIRHSGIKAHLCSICGNGFASKGELCAHLRKHTGARPFVCSICNHGFTTSSSLTKHKRIHSGEKPYECEVCKMRFSRSGILARHKRTHTGEKPYVCKYCTKAFSQSNDLSSHLRIHTGEKPYICDSCGQAFRQSSALKTHKKTHIDKSSLMDSRVVIGMVHQTLFNTLQ